jgi:cell division protein ZapA
MSDAAPATPVSVRILDKEFLIACPPEQRAALAQSAELLNEQLREIRGTGKVVGLERMMVMAALNMANDLVRLRAREQERETQLSARLRQMHERVENVVGQSRQLEL